jgi:hypothetical protein
LIASADDLSRAFRARGHACLHSGGDVGKRGLRIAENADLGRIAFADLPRVGVEMDQRHAWGQGLHLRRQRPGEHVAANRQQKIVIVERLAHALLRARHRAAIERMRGGERCGVRHELGVNRRSDCFGQRRQLFVSTTLRNAIAGDDDGTFGLRQQLGGCIHRIDVAAHARTDAGRLQQLDVAVVLQNIARQRQEDRSGRRRQRSLRRAMDELRQVVDPFDLCREFDKGLGQRGQVGRENGLFDQIFGVLLAGGDHDRRARHLRVVEHAHGVAEARRNMQVQHRQLA